MSYMLNQVISREGILVYLSAVAKASNLVLSATRKGDPGGVRAITQNVTVSLALGKFRGFATAELPEHALQIGLWYQWHAESC